MAFCLCSYSWGYMQWGGSRDLSLKHSMTLFNYESTVINTMARVVSLFFIISGYTNHKLPHGFWWQYGLQTSTWLLASALTHTPAYIFSLAHAHQHGFRWQHRPQTSLWPSVITQMIDFSIAFFRSTNQGHPNGLCWHHGPGTSTWSLIAAQTMDIKWPLLVTWTMDINMALGCSRTMDHNVVLTAVHTYRYKYHQH